MSSLNNVDLAGLQVKYHTIYLDEEETRSEIPASLLSRVDTNAVAYTWMSMTGLWDPNNYYGRMGDVYIQTTLYGEEIYIKGEDNRWHEWHKKVDYGIKKWANSPDKFKHSYHPWLRSRLLQFDGTALDWHPRRQYFHHRTAWNAGTHHTLGAPVYDDLDVAWIVRHLNALAVSRGLDPYNSTVCSASSSGVSVGKPDKGTMHHQLKRERSQPHIDPADHTCKRPRQKDAPSGSPPRAMPVPTPSVAPATTNPASQPLASNPTRNSSSQSTSVSTARPHPVIDPSPQPVLSQKPSTSNVSNPTPTAAANTSSLPLTSDPARNPSSQSTSAPTAQPHPVIDPSPQPVLCQKPSTSNVPNLIPTSSGKIPPAPKAVAPQATKQTVQDFLGSLSISLAHHADLFANLGITDLPYMESLACMSKHFLESFVATLRERGFTFMEALVLRSGLNTLRVAAHPKREAPQTSPDTIEVFLKCLSPSLACHARIFDELDINVAHLPVFAKLDADSYGEFEKELSERGVSWVDMFLIKAGLQAFAETREEPLLATG